VKKSLVKLAITSALVVSFAAPTFAATATVNPFSDVPANNWAYGAVNQLAKAGIVTGYADGTFKGDKTITRYEMAAIVAKAMNKTMSADQKAILDKLAIEFGAELGTLGVKVDGMQKQLDNQVKISGDARVRYFNVKDTNDTTDYRARVTFDGKINDNLKFNARLTSGSNNINGTAGTVKLDTANVNTNFLGMNTTLGREDFKLGAGYLADTQINGVIAQTGDFKFFGGTATQNVDSTKAERVYGAEYKTNLLGAAVTADYLKDNTAQTSVYGLNTSFGLIDGVTANAEYYRNTSASVDNTAKAFGVKFNSLGLSATYRNVGANAFNTLSTLDGVAGVAQLPQTTGFKGMEYQYDQAFDKNAALTVKYQDFKDQAGNKIDNRASAVVNVKF
jgi:hypothetical protein